MVNFTHLLVFTSVCEAVQHMHSIKDACNSKTNTVIQICYMNTSHISTNFKLLIG